MEEPQRVESEDAGYSLNPAEREHLVYAFRRIFEPLASILLRAGVRYHEFRDILQAAYIEAAIRDGPPDYREPKPSTEAIAHTIGIPLASIEHLISNPEMLNPPMETSTAVIGAIVTKWSTDPVYLGPYGLPRPLALSVPQEFNLTDLVHSVRNDVDPAIIMEAMIANGTVEKVGSGFVKLTGRNLLFGDSMKVNQYETLGRLMRDLAATINRNQRSEASDKLFQREVFATHPLPASKLDEFSQLTESVMQAALVEIDDWLTQATDSPADEPAIEVGVSIFEFHRLPVTKTPLRELVCRTPDGAVPWKNLKPQRPEGSTV